MAWWPPVISLLERAQQRCLPFPFPFVPSVTDVREWGLEILPPPVAGLDKLLGDALEASLHRILIEAGIAMTPATTVWDPRSWYALFKYGASFAGTAPRLRLYEGSRGLDPRLTAVLAEEVACGVTCFILREKLGVDHIADVYPLLREGDLKFVACSDAENRPDFFCFDNNSRGLLVESKGAMGTRSSIAERVEVEGWNQVMNVQPVKYRLRDKCGRLVIGTHFCIDKHHGRSETTTLLKDPDGAVGDDFPDSDLVLRVAYAKVLRFAGLDILADTLMMRESPPPLNFNAFAINDVTFAALGISVFGGMLVLHGEVLKALINASVTNLRESIPRALAEFRPQRFEIPGGYALSNGLLVLPLVAQ